MIYADTLSNKRPWYYPARQNANHFCPNIRHRKETSRTSTILSAPSPDLLSPWRAHSFVEVFGGEEVASVCLIREIRIGLSWVVWSGAFCRPELSYTLDYSYKLCRDFILVFFKTFFLRRFPSY